MTMTILKVTFNLKKGSDNNILILIVTKTLILEIVNISIVTKIKCTMEKISKYV